MNRKVVNTLMLLVILIFISAIGGYFAFFHQRGIIREKVNKIEQMKKTMLNKDELLDNLSQLKERAAALDSILALRKFNIPFMLSQARFYDFVNRISANFAPESFVNITFENIMQEGSFSYYLYTLSGTAYFNDFYKLIYAIEESKELKKIRSVNLSNLIKVDEDGNPNYLVNFTIKANIYFANNDRFSTTTIKENSLIPNSVYDIFYPAIRNEIPPNLDNLLDVQTAQLLALIPDGAFLVDAKGKTFLLWEGDEVYLGYVTKIDFEKNEVQFILNKGGIIEKVKLTLATEKEKKKSEKK
ncbi:MAG: hypothetical protein V1773_17690 [bacterium]